MTPLDDSYEPDPDERNMRLPGGYQQIKHHTHCTDDGCEDTKEWKDPEALALYTTLEKSYRDGYLEAQKDRHINCPVDE